MSRLRLSRRALLRGASGVALGLPFLNAMGSARAAAPPKRIVFWTTPNGMPMQHWKCNTTAAETSSFDLSPILAPLAPIRQDCTIIEGIGYESSYDERGHAGAHEAGCSSMLTGTWAGEGTQFGGDGKLAGWAVSSSIDHELGKAIGNDTRFPAYYFGVHPSIGVLGSRMFYAGKDEPISPVFDPASAFGSLFAELSLDEATQAKLLANRHLVLDAVMDSAKSLRCQLDAEDRLRLEAHLTQVEEVSKRLDLGGSELPGCEAPVLGAVPNIFAFEEMEALGRLQMDQLVMTLACDQTRVAGFQWAAPGNAGVYTWLGHDKAHHDLSHENTTSANQRLAEIGAWYSQQLVYLVNRLKATPDGEGTTLFDNTLIVCLAECGDPWFHDRHDVPIVIAGSAQGFFETGRYIKVRSEPATPVPHNRLLLSLLESLDVEASSFGEPDYCAGGPLSVLRA
ncbi:MAG: DUF1552 domain-containing protein [Myxococcales bacterium]|nr:DUF1552 domain-containing protein [Myxococcales bacterium]